MPSADERTWVAEALEGDPVAIRRVVDHLTPVIQHRVARVLMRGGGPTGTRHELADLIQEIFMVLFQDDRRVLRTWNPDGPASLRTFVALVAERRAISLVRTRAGQRNVSLESGETLLAEGQEPREVERDAARRQQLTLVWTQLEQELSPLGLSMFRWLFVDEKTVSEIVEENGVSPEAVYAWRSRLRKRVRVLWASLAGDGELDEEKVHVANE